VDETAGKHIEGLGGGFEGESKNQEYETWTGTLKEVA
jgi:hypothetical protein